MTDFEIYSRTIDVITRLNRAIGTRSVLTDSERKACYIHSRIKEYLYNRIDRPDEVFGREIREAGNSTKEFDS